MIDKLGPAGIIANVSRGSIVDEDELIDGLCSGRIGGAALDVFADEATPAERWANVPNTIFSPHVDRYTTGVLRGIYAMAVANLRSFFAGGRLVSTIQEAVCATQVRAPRRERRRPQKMSCPTLSRPNR